MDSMFFSLNFSTSQLLPFICVCVVFFRWDVAFGVKNLVPVPSSSLICN